MRRLIAILTLGAMFFVAVAMAADPVVGTWKLDVEKSKFSPGPAPKSATRVYSEAADGIAFEEKSVEADGKETSVHAMSKANRTYPIIGSPVADTVTAKAVNAWTWDFSLMRAGKLVGTVHRVVSAHGKRLTVHNKGTRADGVAYDDILVFTRQ